MVKIAKTICSLVDSEDSSEKFHATPIAALPSNLETKKKPSEKSLLNYGKACRCWHRHCQCDEKLFENERQAACGQRPLTEIDLCFCQFRAGPFGDRQSDSQGSSAPKNVRKEVGKKVSGRLFKPRSVRLVEVETFFSLAGYVGLGGPRISLHDLS